LTSVLDKVNNREELILMGDFNGRVGRKTWDLVVGNHGEDHINENGARLLELCDQFSLKKWMVTLHIRTFTNLPGVNQKRNWDR
jgi:endonuclease/exonuclease/phosphatase family metal-dependent hydrolase